MRPLSFLAVSGLALTQSFVNGLTLPSELQLQHTKRSVNAQTQQELARIVSSNSTFFAPKDAGFANETDKYMENVKPKIQLSIQIGMESDVAKIVKYANAHGINFYARSAGHSLTNSLDKFEGIQIDLRPLKGIWIQPGNVTAIFQGGVRSNELVPTLWEQGYVTGSGVCNCVSLLGPALGGGHGLQQGKHGLTMDHFVNLNVVLADGSTVKVNETSNPELWWALRGAGQNFGIVTHAESKIWPDNFKTYYTKIYQFGSKSLEGVVENANKLQGNGTFAPPWMASFSLVQMNETLSTTEAMLYWIFVYDGTKEEAAPALKVFDDLEPRSVEEATLPYKDLNGLFGGNIDTPLCAENYTHLIGSGNLFTYNVTSMRGVYDLYNQKIHEHPRLGINRLLMEGYAMAAVKTFPSDASAYPFRSKNIITYFDAKFNTTDDPLYEYAKKWRQETIDIWNAGEPFEQPTAYVNYAAGYESLPSMYGYEPWRLEKLRKLKAKYDPHNRFAYYNPIVPLK